MSIKEALQAQASEGSVASALNGLEGSLTAFAERLRRDVRDCVSHARAEERAMAHEVISSHEATIAQLTKREVLLTECLRETINYVTEARANRAQIAACYPDSSTARELFEKVDALADRLTAALAG